MTKQNKTVTPGDYTWRTVGDRVEILHDKDEVVLELVNRTLDPDVFREVAWILCEEMQEYDPKSPVACPTCHGEGYIDRPK
jgi:hypothetical protein